MFFCSRYRTVVMNILLVEADIFGKYLPAMNWTVMIKKDVLQLDNYKRLMK